MNVVKALPPLVIEEEDLRRFASALEEVLEAAEERLFRSYASLGLELAPPQPGARAACESTRDRRGRVHRRARDPGPARRRLPRCAPSTGRAAGRLDGVGRRGDVLDPHALRRAVDGCDAVFHLAAVYSYYRARRRSAWMRVNVEGTRDVLDAPRVGRRRGAHELVPRPADRCRDAPPTSAMSRRTGS